MGRWHMHAYSTAMAGSAVRGVVLRCVARGLRTAAQRQLVHARIMALWLGAARLCVPFPGAALAAATKMHEKGKRG